MKSGMSIALLPILAITAVFAHGIHVDRADDNENINHKDHFIHDLKLPKVAMTLRDFALNEVRLTPGSPAYDGQMMNAKYLNFLDADRLLYNFMINAGLPTTAKPLGGWESPTIEVRGHFTAMYLSATAKAYNSYGDIAQKEKGDYIVSQLAKCQQALGGYYLAAFPTSFFDRLEALQPVWAPYYMIHKIMQGLYDMHTLAGNEQAFPMILNMATYFAERVKNVVAKYSLYRWQLMLQNEYGGWNEFMYILYNRTGNPDHLYLAQMFDMGSFLGPLAMNQDWLTTFHANQHIPIVLGATARYETLGDPISKVTAENFWNFVYYNHSFATGGTSGGNGTDDATNEHWGDPGKIANTLTNNNQETCVTYNMLKLVKHLIQWSAQIEYFDHYEKAYFNGILGTQDLTSGPGVFIYNYPMATGFSKNTSLHGWGTPLDSFWCCYATSVEQWAKMGEAIYFRTLDDSAVVVNLFIPSVLTWTSRNISIVQSTAFPVGQWSKFTINIPNGKTSTFAFNIRIPYWVVVENAVVTINGQKQALDIRPASFVSLSRTWKHNDTIEITLPMGFHASATPDNEKLIAVMYGPLVLGGLTNNAYRLPISDQNQLTSIITSGGLPLSFKIKTTDGVIPLVPLYTLVNENYGVYWELQ